MIKLYPNTVHYSEKDLNLLVYQNLLDGKIQQYPKELFTGTDGLLRAQAQYMIGQHPAFRTVRKMYGYSALPACDKILRKYRLLTICGGLFEPPLEYRHTTLPKGLHQICWYRPYRFSKTRCEQIACKEGGARS